jgi:hypothetical protein
MAMRLPDETRATNAAENMSVFAPHFHSVFNNNRGVDMEYANRIPQQRTLWELDDPITWTEFTKAVNKLKNAKASWTHRGAAGSIQSHVR